MPPWKSVCVESKIPMSDLKFGQTDLSSCDREAIHIPGSIQPHGVLLVVNRKSLAIAQFAGASLQLLGVEPARLAKCLLPDLFEASTLSLLAQQLHAPDILPIVLPNLKARQGTLALNATVHVQGDLGLIELEAADSSAAGPDLLTQVGALLQELPAASSLNACCEIMTTQLRAATGFDRVMVYQFLHDGSGMVVAESKAARLAPFLGLHYPASDIPQQARALYLRNWLRLIPDISYTPAPLQSTAPDASPKPLDLSQCMLRSASPIHLEYLRNMGVRATLTLSIVVGNQLWGLIACHHDSPRHLPAPSRSGCELMTQIFCMQLQARIAIDTAQRSLAPAHIQETLARNVLSDGDLAAALVGGKAPLLDLIAARGAGVMLDGKLSLTGDTPPADFVADLVQWLHARKQPVFSTYALGSSFAPAKTFVGVASGLLAVSLSPVKPDYVLWFRPEMVRTVTWAGDPSKPVQPGPNGDRLTPRKSFAAWETSVREQSAPWDAADLATAHAFRLWLLETVLRQMELARLAREAAFSQQSLLMAELDHRVKNTLANIQAMVQHTRAGAPTLDSFARGLERRIGAMAHAHRLLANSRWQGATVRGLLDEELAPFQGVKNVFLRGENVLLSPAAALTFNLLMHELISNATKYGALSTQEGCIHIDWSRQSDGALEFCWKERGGPPVTPPTRRGFGSVIILRSLRHELQGSSSLNFEPDGVSCVVTIPAVHLVPAVEKEMPHV